MEFENKHKACPTHCCIIHGCKYGHEDCPVYLGKIKQVYLCEYCCNNVYAPDSNIPNSKIAKNKIDKEFLKVNRSIKLKKLKYV